MSPSEALPTTAIDTMSKFIRQSATGNFKTSEGLAKGSYVVARAGFEPMILWSKGIDSTNAPPCSTTHVDIYA